ncbi:MAG TPA: disulfide oxidoreductase [Acidimicrobiia bacterium]|nr:disulfide oxidoreductase [Acidimicrobiia bacterium]
MDEFAYSTFTAVMALVALGLAVVAVAVRATAPPDTRIALAEPARWLAWMVAAAAMIGSLIYSEIYHFEPCRLCWFQRIAMYPMAAVLLVGAIRRDPSIRLYGLPLSVIGLAISIWHYTIQNFPSLEGGSCDPANPCSAKLVDMFGFVSIPFMAGAGFLLITVLLASFTHPTQHVSRQ